MTQGIIIDNNSVESSNAEFDTRRPRLQVALQRNPPHLDILNLAATNLAVNAGNSYYARETLFEMKHDLDYRPKVLLYIYNPGDASGATGSGYAIGTFVFGTGAAIDQIKYEVNDTYFRIYHEVDNTLIPSDFTSNAATFGKMRYKYMIFSNPIDNLTNPQQR